MAAPRIALGLALLVVVSLVLRSTGLDAGYWIDEGLSVGIAHHPLDEIPGLLRQDGSPPLFYALLHGWIAIFGDTEAATRSLSLVAGLAAIPVAWWAGRIVGGDRCAWMAAGLVATGGYLTYYAQETRMYALVVLLSLVVAALAVRVFVARRRRAIPWLVGALATVALTHNWGLFLVAAVLVAGPLAGGPCGLYEASRDDGPRARIRDALLVGAGVAVLYAPWLPTLLFQASNTGAPWSQSPGLGELAATLAVALGGTAPAVVLLAIGLVGLARSAGGRDPRNASVGLLALVATGTIVLAFVASHVEPGWAGRYAAVILGPAILLAAATASRAGAPGTVAVVIVCTLGLLDPRTAALQRRDNVRAVAAQLGAAGIGRGDVVVSAHPERGPVLRHYLGGGPRYRDLLGAVPDAQLFDWRDALDRLEAAAPAVMADAAVIATPAGRRLVLVLPEVRRGRWTAPWTSLVRARSSAWERILLRDPRLQIVARVPEQAREPRPRTVRALVFVRAG